MKNIKRLSVPDGKEELPLDEFDGVDYNDVVEILQKMDRLREKVGRLDYRNIEDLRQKLRLLDEGIL